MLQAERLEKPRSGLAGFAPHCPTAQLGGVILITSLRASQLKTLFTVHWHVVTLNLSGVSRRRPPMGCDPSRSGTLHG
jgi:hypothetical protein